MPREDTQFKKGHKGPGRPRGSKNKVTKAYLQDIYEHYLEEGKDAIKRVCKERPDVYLKLVAQLIPKDLDIKQSGDVQVSIVRFKDMYKDK